MAMAMASNEEQQVLNYELCTRTPAPSRCARNATHRKRTS